LNALVPNIKYKIKDIKLFSGMWLQVDSSKPEK
jgi:hypothetical protein